MKTTTKTGLYMTNTMEFVENGFGTAIDSTTGLSSMTKTKMNECNPKSDVGTARTGTVMTLANKLGLGIADLTQGVATNSKTKMKLNEDEMIVRTANSMQNKCVSASPKTPKMKC